MKDDQRKELAQLIDKFSPEEGFQSTMIPGVNGIRLTQINDQLPSVYTPSLCIIVQGKKRVLLGDEIYQYQPSEYLVVSVDLPVIGQVIEASRDKPYLCLQIELDLHELAELMLQTKLPVKSKAQSQRGIFVGDVDELLGDGVLRLARLQEASEDIALLAPMIKREIHYRLLNGQYGNVIAQMAQTGSHMQRISNAIKVLKTNYHKPIKIEDLATQVGMSISSFHSHFKAVTAMSPLQYQKRLRLLEARKIMLAETLDAASTAYQVGYESPSQFNREYVRMFGHPPKRDMALLLRERAIA
ncbi:MAG: AraC family transcriptional regulator [Methylophaga sp.]|uniref:AraC family transcriptional regulator n=1 Tax=Methylophaga sp. TaxID=2024840 RepID=UPI00299D2BF6|nr:AraC family transcriptional regulator [Methylophaga sp.]MDX1749205.1 AraC family transcriptional regulator [Methylophaga sp.]